MANEANSSGAERRSADADRRVASRRQPQDAGVMKALVKAKAEPGLWLQRPPAPPAPTRCW